MSKSVMRDVVPRASCLIRRILQAGSVQNLCAWLRHNTNPSRTQPCKPIVATMALSSLGGSEGRNAFTPFRNPSRDVGATRAGPDMRLEVTELETAFEVKANIPGMNKADIKVHVDADKIIVSLERTNNKLEDTDEQGVRFYRMERSSQYVRRTIRMPEMADLDHMKARYEDGILQLSIPKRQVTGTQQQAGPYQ